MDPLWWILIGPVIFIVLMILEWVIFRATSLPLPPYSCFLRPALYSEFGTYDHKVLGPQSDVDPEIMAKTTTVTFSDGKVFKRTRPNPAELTETICKIFLQSNTTPPTANIPEDLQGVFWMDGNGFPEELVCTNYATYDHTHNFLTIPWTYRMWSWLDNGDPGSTNVMKHGQAAANIANYPKGPTGMLVFAFDDKYPMQHTADYTQRPAAQLSSKTSFKYSDESAGSRLQHWSLTPLPGKSPQSVDFQRGIKMLGIFSEIPCSSCLRPCVPGAGPGSGNISFSYTMRKIMHTDLTKIQPAYDEFVEYMRTKQAGKGLLTHTAVNGGKGPQFLPGGEPGPPKASSGMPVAPDDLESALSPN